MRRTTWLGAGLVALASMALVALPSQAAGFWTACGESYVELCITTSPLSPEAYCDLEPGPLNQKCAEECGDDPAWHAEECEWEDPSPCTEGTQVMLTCHYIEP